MEHMVKSRMEWVMDKGNYLYKGQCGFRPGRGTTEALVRLENEIQSGFASKKKVLAVFLDMSRAFDRVWWPAVVAKLKKGGIEGKMLRWVANFLQEIKMTVKINGSLSNDRNLPLGTLQGSVLSPLLFLAMVNDLGLEVKKCKVSFYADDTTIYFAH